MAYGKKLAAEIWIDEMVNLDQRERKTTVVSFGTKRAAAEFVARRTDLTTELVKDSRGDKTLVRVHLATPLTEPEGEA